MARSDGTSVEEFQCKLRAVRDSVGWLREAGILRIEIGDVVVEMGPPPIPPEVREAAKKLAEVTEEAVAADPLERVNALWDKGDKQEQI